MGGGFYLNKIYRAHGFQRIHPFDDIKASILWNERNFTLKRHVFHFFKMTVVGFPTFDFSEILNT